MADLIIHEVILLISISSVFLSFVFILMCRHAFILLSGVGFIFICLPLFDKLYKFKSIKYLLYAK